MVSKEGINPKRAKDRRQRWKSVDPATLWFALQQLTAAVKHLEGTAKDVAERHAAEIASLREQLYHREGTFDIKVDSALTQKVEKGPCTIRAAAIRRYQSSNTGPEYFDISSPPASPQNKSRRACRSRSQSPDCGPQQDGGEATNVTLPSHASNSHTAAGRLDEESCNEPLLNSSATDAALHAPFTPRRSKSLQPQPQQRASPGANSDASTDTGGASLHSLTPLPSFPPWARPDEVNSPSMKAQEVFEIEKEYDSLWCEAANGPRPILSGDFRTMPLTAWQKLHSNFQELSLGKLPSELRSHISSYLDVPGLCAQRAAAREKDSRKAFVAQLVQLLRPDTLDVFTAYAETYVREENRYKHEQCEQAIARECFQRFAGLQGLKCLFNKPEEFNVWWASNPGAITHWFACWIEHTSSSPPLLQTALLRFVVGVFESLDWGALHIKQMFAATVRRFETESRDKSTQRAVSIVLHKFPEIRLL